MSFDTTAFTTGKLKGTCISLETILGHPLLRTACRRHGLEIVWYNAVQKLYVSTYSSQK